MSLLRPDFERRCGAHEHRLRQCNQRIEELENALRFYAPRGNYPTNTVGSEFTSCVVLDAGHTAREALGISEDQHVF